MWQGMCVQKILNDIARVCKGPAKGRGGLPEEVFTENLSGGL